MILIWAWLKWESPYDSSTLQGFLRLFITIIIATNITTISTIIIITTTLTTAPITIVTVIVIIAISGIMI